MVHILVSLGDRGVRSLDQMFSDTPFSVTTESVGWHAVSYVLYRASPVRFMRYDTGTVSVYLSKFLSLPEPGIR